MKDLRTKKRNNEVRQVAATTGTIDFTTDSIVAGTEYIIGTLPAGAIVTGAYLNVTAAGAGTGDFGFAGAAEALGNDKALDSAGLVNLSPTAVTYTVNKDIVFTGTGTNNTGAFSLTVEYIDVDKRTNMYTA